MKKNIFALIALAVAFVGCSKEASETPSPAAEGQKFVLMGLLKLTNGKSQKSCYLVVSGSGLS